MGEGALARLGAYQMLTRVPTHPLNWIRSFLAPSKTFKLQL